MAECSSVENASEEVCEFVCGPCNVDGDVLQAKGYCYDCEDYLCDLCFKHHLRPKPMRNHVLVNENSMPNAAHTNDSESDTYTAKCQKHFGSIIEYYCKGHDFLGCCKCIISDNHRKCEDVVCIEEAAHGIYDSQEYKSFEEKQQNQTNILQEIKSSIAQRNEDVALGFTRSKNDFKTFRAKLEIFLDNLEKDIDTKALEIHEEQSTTLKIIYQELDGIDTDMKEMKKCIDRKKKSSQHNDSFIAMKIDLRKIKENQDRLDAMNAKIKKISPIVFKPDSYLEKSINSVKQLGELLCKTNNPEQKVTDEIEILATKSTKAKVIGQTEKACKEARAKLEYAEEICQIPREFAGKIIGEDGKDIQDIVDKSGAVHVKIGGYDERDTLRDELRRKTKAPAEQEMADFNDLITWCTTEAEEVLQIVEQPVTDRQQEYMDYLAFKAEVDRRANEYNKLESGKAVSITKEQFKPLEEIWKKVFRQARLWLWKLDASLPGKLGKFGDWLNQAEEILEQEEDLLENPEEMAAQLGSVLQEHKKFFKELESKRQFFTQVKRAGRYEGEFIPGPQLESLHQRLQKVCTQAPLRERRLDFEELKYQLQAYLVASDNKLNIWTVKYGRQEDVEELLADYTDFVHTKTLLKNYDKTYDNCKRNADAYRKVKIPKEEVDKMNNYFDEINGRWKKVSDKIKIVQSMFDEVIDCWKKYNAYVDVLTVWVNDGEKIMTRFAEEKQQYEDNRRILNESCNSLIETVEEPVAAEIKQTLLVLNRRFKDLVEQYTHYKQVDVVGKARNEYTEGLLRLTQWLKGAEYLLAQEVPCRHALLKEYLNELDTYAGQIPSVESDFKVTTKTAQSLVKESSHEVVKDMLQSLNIQKEVLVRLRNEIPEKTKYLNAVLPDIESLETGLLDLNTWWLDNGETLLEFFKLDGTQEETEGRLERHKAFLSDINYHNSIVESMNKVYQKVNATKSKLKNIDFSVVDQPMDEINQRFQLY